MWRMSTVSTILTPCGQFRASPFLALILETRSQRLFSCEWVQEITRVLKRVLIEEMRTPVPASPVRTPVFLESQELASRSPEGLPLGCRAGTWGPRHGSRSPGSLTAGSLVLLGMLHLPHKQRGLSLIWALSHTPHATRTASDVLRKKHEADLGGGAPPRFGMLTHSAAILGNWGFLSPRSECDLKRRGVDESLQTLLFSPHWLLQSDSLPERAKIDI